MERRGVVDRTIAVAIDKEKSSQYAVKWAIDNLVSRDQILKLVHVKERSSQISSRSSLPEGNNDPASEQGIDDETNELLLPFRCFCRRRQVQCETMVLEDTDVAKALIEFVAQVRVETLLLGTPARSALSRLFKTSDVPGNVLKWAPDYCTIYVITKGRVSSVRNATRPVPTVAAAAGVVPHNFGAEPLTTIGNEELFDELSAADNDISAASSGRQSTDSDFMAFYENLECGLGEDSLSCFNLERAGQPPDFPRCSSTESGDLGSFLPVFRPPAEVAPVNEFSRLDNCRMSCSVQNAEARDEEIRMLKTELKQTMDMYHAACKEALAAKQKVMELEGCKLTEEKRIQEALKREQNAIALIEKEKAKCKAAIEEAEATRKLLGIEMQRRVSAEVKALSEATEKKNVFNALGHSKMALKYQSLYHILTVVIMVYFYLSL